MVLGAAILITVMWGTVAPRLFAAWMGAIIVNQAWRLWLVRRYRAAAPEPVRRAQWGRAWAVGSMLAGALWGVAGVVLFVPGDPGPSGAAHRLPLRRDPRRHQSHCSLQAFAFTASCCRRWLPLIVRVAMEGDQLHAFIAAVMLVVLAFILGFGHNLNNVLTQSLAIRYENVDLIGELQAQTAAADHARATAEAANRGKTQFLAAASHDLRQPLHALGLFVCGAGGRRCASPSFASVVGNINASVDALERLFSSHDGYLQARRRRGRAGALRIPCWRRCSTVSMRAFAAVAATGRLRLSVVATRAWVDSDPLLLERILFNLVSNAVRYTERGGVVLGVRRRGALLAIDVCDSGIGISALRTRAHLRGVLSG